MIDTNKLLNDFLRLHSLKSDLLKQIDEKNRNLQTPQVVVTMEDLKNLIRAGLEKKISKVDFSDWVDFIWFSDYYKYEDKDNEAIAEIMNDIEDAEQLTDDKYLDLLTQVNTDILEGKYPRY